MTDETMVEELARAICRVDGAMGDTEAVEQQRVDQDWRDYAPAARTVLASPTFTRLRNPPLTGDVAELVEQLRAFSNGCRGSMWQSRDETIRLMDEAANTLTRLIAERDGAYERAAQVVEQHFAKAPWNSMGDQFAASITAIRIRSGEYQKEP